MSRELKRKAKQLDNAKAIVSKTAAPTRSEKVAKAFNNLDYRVQMSGPETLDIDGDILTTSNKKGQLGSKVATKSMHKSRRCAI